MDSYVRFLAVVKSLVWLVALVFGLGYLLHSLYTGQHEPWGLGIAAGVVLLHGLHSWWGA